MNRITAIKEPTDSAQSKQIAPLKPADPSGPTGHGKNNSDMSVIPKRVDAIRTAKTFQRAPTRVTWLRIPAFLITLALLIEIVRVFVYLLVIEHVLLWQWRTEEFIETNTNSFIQETFHKASVMSLDKQKSTKKSFMANKNTDEGFSEAMNLQLKMLLKAVNLPRNRGKVQTSRERSLTVFFCGLLAC